MTTTNCHYCDEPLDNGSGPIRDGMHDRCHREFGADLAEIDAERSERILRDRRTFEELERSVREPEHVARLWEELCPW